jgi:hypothetical protein
MTTIFIHDQEPEILAAFKEMVEKYPNTFDLDERRCDHSERFYLALGLKSKDFSLTLFSNFYDERIL